MDWKRPKDEWKGDKRGMRACAGWEPGQEGEAAAGARVGLGALFPRPEDAGRTFG